MGDGIGVGGAGIAAEVGVGFLFIGDPFVVYVFLRVRSLPDSKKGLPLNSLCRTYEYA